MGGMSGAPRRLPSRVAWARLAGEVLAVNAPISAPPARLRFGSVLRRASVAVVRRASAATLDLLLPPQCAACNAPVDEQGQLCAACFGAATLLAGPSCEHCGVPVDPDWSGLACLECATRPPPWRQARAALRYDALARRLILPLKYGDRPELARALAVHMVRIGAVLLREADLLVPVPLHRRRLFARRYNQAALLARECGRLAQKPALLDALQRIRATQPLHDKGPAARQAELHGAIRANPARLARLRGARVLLVDDVLTSGATAAACTGALQAAGAAQVDLLVAARTVRDEGDEEDG